VREKTKTQNNAQKFMLYSARLSDVQHSPMTFLLRNQGG